ncbi:MAG: hypothetical protein KJ070_14225 [Verrucomicrobia bacterium]|nr:hypothetical protein [Verrucomicrobiota bacterium]
MSETRASGFAQKLQHELKAVLETTLYFAVWLGVLVVLKQLVLEDYQIRFRGVTTALVGALVLAKVVLILEHVSLGEWLRRRPALLDVVIRTLLYGLGVLLVLVLEKAFEARHEPGGFVQALGGIFAHPDMPHVLANAICVTSALFVFNTLSVVRRHLGPGGLHRLLLSRPGPAAEQR